MDVIALHQAGFDNAVATLGTSLTDEQARLISQYADKVVLAYDSDGPGQPPPSGPSTSSTRWGSRSASFR